MIQVATGRTARIGVVSSASTAHLHGTVNPRILLLSWESALLKESRWWHNRKAHSREVIPCIRAFELSQSYPVSK